MFQRQVNLTQAPAVVGQVASVNPRHSALTVEGGFVAGASGVSVGLFAWAANDANGVPRLLNNTGSGQPTGIVIRAEQALITAYLAEYGNLIPAGFAVGDIINGGDVWMNNAGGTAATVGMKAFAKTADGTTSFAAAGATVAGSVETKFYACTAGAASELIKISDTF
nr:MAG TPA: hypothetical protein [Caudoviricetes sp.]